MCWPLTAYRGSVGSSRLPTEDRMRGVSILGALLITTALAWTTNGSAEDPSTRVVLNGTPTPVYFNDGDSFRVLSGPLAGSTARLSGFNTLESFGPVHRWGEWHPYELYINAKMATLNARRGSWHCTSDLGRDGYGRILWDCPDLAIDHLSKGLAHAMNIDDEPSRAEYLRAQQLAILQRRGMWAHGVPEFVLTSGHSADEDPSRDWHYDRRVSVRYGNSESVRHHNTYLECQMVCHDETTLDGARSDTVAQRLLEVPELNAQLTQFSTIHLGQLTWRWARTHEFPTWVPEALHAPLTERLTVFERDGAFGPVRTQPGACFRYVAFNRRYGNSRAECLNEH
jgi:endonuclease YncB( thermonuclease family)